MGNRFDWNRLDTEPLYAPGLTVTGHPFTRLHFLPQSEAEAWVQQAIKLGNQAEFERAMHALHDSQPHYGGGYRWKDDALFSGYGHAAASIKDKMLPGDQNPDNNPAAWSAAESLTQKYVAEWIKNWGPPPARDMGPIYGEGMQEGARPIKLEAFEVKATREKPPGKS